MKFAVEIKDLCKKYPNNGGTGEVTALENLNLQIPEGSCFALLGPNGAGKSTTINIMAGLTVKTSGKVFINGYDIDEEVTNAKKSIGIVPQEVYLDPFFTVEETLDFHAGYYGVPKSKRRTKEILRAMHLEDKAKMQPRKLSGGMRRRLLVAKALVHNPKVLVLDEPTAGIDVELRHQLWEYVAELNKMGTTIILTTHYLEEAEQLCDRVAVINKGKLIANDKISNVLHILDRKKMIIKVGSDPNNIVDKLSEFNPVVEGDKIILEYGSRANVLNQIIEIIHKSGCIINDISVKEPKLEDVFIHLTK